MKDFICNVLVMGATGSGKSSLLNYLCGENLAKAGAGKPVTGEGIFEYDVALNGQTVRLFDSWGIEADKVERWKSIIDKELATHGADKPIEEWFHSVIYCIQAGGARIQDTDLEIIRNFFCEGYNVVIVLTKADQVSAEDQAKMEKTIRQEVVSSVEEGKSFNVISCCSVEKKTRYGDTKAFGRDEIIEQIKKNWFCTVLDRLPRYVIKKLEDEIDIWGEKTKNKIRNEYTIHGTKKANIDVYKKLREEFDTFQTRLNNEILPQTIYDAVWKCYKIRRVLCVIMGQENSSEERFSTNIKTNSRRSVIEKIRIFFRERYNKKNKEDQKRKMEDWLDEKTEELKEHIRSDEKQIKSQIFNLILMG